MKPFSISILLSMLTMHIAHAQYITEVLDYRPAPGQFINEAPWGRPASAESLVGGINGSLSLGAFGGSVVFRFAKAVENHPDNPYGVDFTIFGNPLPDWSEPASVWVMEDENENGLPDDTWYELAGSDYWFSTTRRGAGITYVNPMGSGALDVPWIKEDGTSGMILANSVHMQSYYPLPDSFPAVPADSLVLEGTLIRGRVDVEHPPIIKSNRRFFGYADNCPRGSGDPLLPDNPYTTATEGSGGDAFDLDWAVDSTGMQVSLDSVHFIRVQTALLHEGGYLGEVSAEITGAVDVAPAPGITGPTELLVLEDLPPEIHPGTHKLKAHYFQRGRPGELPPLSWDCSESWAGIDSEGILSVEGTGTLEISVSAENTTNLEDRTDVLVSLEAIEPTGTGNMGVQGISRIYPNPSRDFIVVEGELPAQLVLCGIDGRVLRSWRVEGGRTRLDLSDLDPGIYLLNRHKIVIR